MDAGASVEWQDIVFLPEKVLNGKTQWFVQEKVLNGKTQWFLQEKVLNGKTQWFLQEKVLNGKTQWFVQEKKEKKAESRERSCKGVRYVCCCFFKLYAL